MADNESKKQDAKVTDAQKSPRSQTKGDTPQPQVRVAVEEASAFAGDNAAVVNPALKSNSASIVTGVDENGLTEVETFYLGEVYHVNDEALEVKNTEEVAFLVAAE